MRLLLVTNDFPPTLGGIENFMLSVATRWRGGEITVLTRPTPGCSAYDESLGIEVLREPVGALPAPRLARRVMEIARSRDIDGIHFASPLPFILIGPEVRRRLGIPFSVSLHGGDFLFPASVPGGSFLLRRALNQAAVLLPNSTYTDEKVRAFLGEEAVTEILTPGVDTERFHPQAPRPASLPDAPLIVSVCRLVSRKGPATIIRAMPRILRRHPQVRAVIVGDGPDAGRLRRLAQSAGCAHAVIFTGPVPWDEVPGYYAAARLFAHPTRERFGGIETEGFGMVYLEAAAAGRPAVAGDAGGVRDAVVDRETGYIVSGDRPYGMAEAAVALIEDPARADAMGAAARARVEERFTWDQVGTRFGQLLAKHMT